MFCNANSSEHRGQPLLEISNLRVGQLIRNLAHRSLENDLLGNWPIKNRNLDFAESREIGEFQGRNIFWFFCGWWITRIYDTEISQCGWKIGKTSPLDISLPVEDNFC